MGHCQHLGRSYSNAEKVSNYIR